MASDHDPHAGDRDGCAGAGNPQLAHSARERRPYQGAPGRHEHMTFHNPLLWAEGR